MDQQGPFYSNVLIGHCQRQASVPPGGNLPKRAWDLGLRDSATYAAAMRREDLRTPFNPARAVPAWLRWTQRFRQRGVFDPIFSDPVEIRVDVTSGVFKEVRANRYGCLEDVASCLHHRQPDGKLVPVGRAFLTHTPVATSPHGVAKSVPTSPRIEENPDVWAEIAACAPSYEREPETERQAIIAARLGQGRFREALLKLWSGRCAVTGCALRGVLRASHIKAWKLASNAERLDPHNGLPLVPNLDALFDRGCISFADDGKIVLGPAVTKSIAAVLGVTPTMRLQRVLPPSRPFLALHRRWHGFDAP